MTRTRDAIAAALAAASRTGVVFKNLSSLASHIAPRCAQTAGNLRRNIAYRELLERHLAGQRGAVGIVGGRTTDAALLKAKLLASQLELGNALRAKQRLEAFIAAKLSSQADPGQLAVQGEITSPDKPDFRHRFECTAHALRRIMEEARTFAIDPVKFTIIDRAARPGSETVVEANHARFYIEWTQDQVEIK